MGLHETKTELAVRLLRDKIRLGELEPGERLSPVAIAEQLEMSPTPVREALRLLQSDGLIVYRPHQGIEVAGLPADDAAEIYMLRRLLEPVAMERAVPAITGPELRKLEKLHDRLRDAVATGQGRKIAEANAAWHWYIYEQSGTRYLTEFIRRLWARFPWRTMWVIPQRAERTLAEHEEMMEAIRAGDAQEAAQLLRAHIMPADHGDTSIGEELAGAGAREPVSSRGAAGPGRVPA
ncbi:MAG TPA: GntR family transcriptional regulator [Solirubrobacteraceae bacterium]|jgi:DNA-binding GntR family transcriptional regulator